MDLAALVRRLETAQALQSRSFFLQAAQRDPDRGVKALRGRWGFAHFLAEGHFLNQGLALGLGGPLTERQLDRLEALLGAGGHPVLLELAPTADPGLAALLAARGYEIRAFQQVFWRKLSAEPASGASARFQVRGVGPAEADLWHRVVQAGFQDRDDLTEAEDTAAGFPEGSAGNRFLLASVDGEPAGAAMLGCFGRVAVLSGSSVLPRFRGLGLQRRLITARLNLALDAGCRLACSAVLPGTGSQANLERCGFRVAYPKLEMARQPEL